MQCYTPDHRTISDFRKNNLKEIERYFVDIVRIFSASGYTQIGKIYPDGTKIKGNASAKRTKDKAGFEKWLSEITDIHNSMFYLPLIFGGLKYEGLTLTTSCNAVKDCQTLTISAIDFFFLNKFWFAEVGTTGKNYCKKSVNKMW